MRMVTFTNDDDVDIDIADDDDDDVVRCAGKKGLVTQPAD